MYVGHSRRRRQVALRRRRVQSDGHQRYPKKYPNQRGKVRRPVRPQHKTPEVQTEVQPEVQPVVQPEVKPKSHFDGCLYTHGLGFLSSTMIEPRFNDDNFFGRFHIFV